MGIHSYPGCQDTFYVNNMQGISRIYQQTFIDNYSKVAVLKLYDRKVAPVSADLLNNRVIPFFDAHEIPWILADLGT